METFLFVLRAYRYDAAAEGCEGEEISSFMNDEYIQFNKGAVNAVECIKKGWEILKPNYFPFFGIGLIIVVLGCIPVVSWFLMGPLMVGVYAGLLSQYRGEKTDFGKLFSGFSKFFPALVIGLLLLMPGIVLNSYNLLIRIAQVFALFNPNELTAGAATLFGLFGVLLNVLALVGSIVFGISFVFGLPLLADMELPLSQTIKLSAKAGWANAGGLFLLFLLLGLIAIGGVIALCVGIFFVLPLIYAALTVAYRQVFPFANSSSPFSAPTPPTSNAGM